MFHTNLKSIRLSCKLSQQQVADFLNVTPQSISKWEKGTALPSIEYLPKLAELLDCSIDDFFNHNLSETPNLSVLKEFFNVMIGLIYNRTKNRDDVISFIKEHPVIMDIFPKFCRELNQHQTVSRKMLQTILSCSKDEVSAFIDLLKNCRRIEKLNGTNYFFVPNESGYFLLTLLQEYSEYTTNEKLSKLWAKYKEEYPSELW